MEILSPILGIALLGVLALLLVSRRNSDQLRKEVEAEGKKVAAARREAENAQAVARETVNRTREEAASAVAAAQKLIDQQRTELKNEELRIQEHFEREYARFRAETSKQLRAATQRVAELQMYQDLLNEEGSAQQQVVEAMRIAVELREQGQTLLQAARSAAAVEQRRATEKSREIAARADALLDSATREAGRLVEAAHRKAHDIAGDAYLALREKEKLEQALEAVRNVIEGYGDRYIIPTRSILDDLAADFGHTEAGQALAAAREQTKRMVEERQAAECDYSEEVRRSTAIRFAIDAFNGRVDAILSRSRHDNRGTLAQEIRDAFALVNKNGSAFRNARILPSYLDARLNELKWAVVVHELRLKEREEQRRIKEQIREEEKAQREFERAMEAAKKEERAIENALEAAREQAAHASAEQRAEMERRIAELREKLVMAEAKNQRAMSMAQQTRKGTIYVISNLGSFGEQVFKVGMTRRLEPQDRIKELSDASVPFDFDVHAMISCDDAPALEAELHRQFDGSRMNKVDYRKEFFRMPLDQLREAIVKTGYECSFTMLAEAREYRETQAIEKMSPEERQRYLAS